MKEVFDLEAAASGTTWQQSTGCLASTIVNLTVVAGRRPIARLEDGRYGHVAEIAVRLHLMRSQCCEELVWVGVGPLASKDAQIRGAVRSLESERRGPFTGRLPHRSPARLESLIPSPSPGAP